MVAVFLGEASWGLVAETDVHFKTGYRDKEPGARCPPPPNPNDLLLVMPHNSKVFRSLLKRVPPVGDQAFSL